MGNSVTRLCHVPVLLSYPGAEPPRSVFSISTPCWKIKTQVSRKPPFLFAPRQYLRSRCTAEAARWVSYALFLVVGHLQLLKCDNPAHPASDTWSDTASSLDAGQIPSTHGHALTSRQQKHSNTRTNPYRSSSRAKAVHPDSGHGPEWKLINFSAPTKVRGPQGQAWPPTRPIGRRRCTRVIKSKEPAETAIVAIPPHLGAYLLYACRELVWIHLQLPRKQPDYQ